MPATPAWPPRSLPRLFVETALGAGARVELDAAQANYLGNVMRLKEGDRLLLLLPFTRKLVARALVARVAPRVQLVETSRFVTVQSIPMEEVFFARQRSAYEPQNVIEAEGEIVEEVPQNRRLPG